MIAIIDPLCLPCEFRAIFCPIEILWFYDIILELSWSFEEKWGDERMKTRNTGLTILAESPKKLPADRDDIVLSIRTPEGDLMTNRVRALLREYGDRVQMSPSLMLEILEDRNRKSRELKSAEEAIDAFEEFGSGAIMALVELQTATSKLVDAIINAPHEAGLVDVTEQLEEVNCALELVDDFWDDFVTFECDEDCDEECDEI